MRSSSSVCVSHAMRLAVQQTAQPTAQPKPPKWLPSRLPNERPASPTDFLRYGRNPAGFRRFLTRPLGRQHFSYSLPTRHRSASADDRNLNGHLLCRALARFCEKRKRCKSSRAVQDDHSLENRETLSATARTPGAHEEKSSEKPCAHSAVGTHPARDITASPTGFRSSCLRSRNVPYSGKGTRPQR